MTINFEELCPVTQQQVQALMKQGDLEDHQQDLNDSLGLTNGDFCETTQQQLRALLDHEQHLEEASEDFAITDLRTVQGLPVQLEDIQPDTLITVNGITGKVDDMIEAGIVSKSVYAGNFEDYLNDAEACMETEEEPEDTEAYRIDNPELTETVSQIEEVLGTATTNDTISDILAGNELSPEVLEELSESYGVSPDRAQREIESLAENLMGSFEDYLEEQHQGIDINHLSEWVSYAANKDTKVMQLYQQALTGGLNGDLAYSGELIEAYKRFYSLY
ncbi:hypothetical protein [Aliiglaciecola lipolytica]|uniref:hypothetical protein n=1 Tax=Aliiglaciecola lipolytica TaxID=477689 RepID=UPI001C0A40AD|nr:hypothetical protein [Aliiglaciecola lipolytica]MBU2877588.1 hypothetical protein [Aliiglaciecola lipolytica]